MSDFDRVEDQVCQCSARPLIEVSIVLLNTRRRFVGYHELLRTRRAVDGSDELACKIQVLILFFPVVARLALVLGCVGDSVANRREQGAKGQHVPSYLTPQKLMGELRQSAYSSFFSDDPENITNSWH